jgi:anti-sigma factor (TIGR02949 family)
MNAEQITCEEVIEQLFEFLDRELESELGHRIDHHLERCRDCYTRAEFEKRLRSKVNEATEAKAPERLRSRLRQVIDDFERRGSGGE